MTNKTKSTEFRFWVDSVDASAELSGEGIGLLKLEARHFHAPGELREHPVRLELVIDSQQLEKLLNRLQTLNNVVIP